MNANLINIVGGKTNTKEYSCASSASPTSFLSADCTTHDFLSVGFQFFRVTDIWSCKLQEFASQ